MPLAKRLAAVCIALLGGLLLLAGISPAKPLQDISILSHVKAAMTDAKPATE